MEKIIAIVLAAGYSSRMKRNKMLLPFGDSTVIENTVQGLFRSLVDGVAVVVGNEQAQIRQALANYPVQFIENPRFAQGMSSSVQEGIRVLQEDPELAGVMLIPGDMPLVQWTTVNAVLQKFAASDFSIIIPVYQGKKGHPVLFSKTLFPQLLEISGDVGAREVVWRNSAQCCFLEVDDPGILIDIDSPEEYARWNKDVKNK